MKKFVFRIKTLYNAFMVDSIYDTSQLVHVMVHAEDPWNYIVWLHNESIDYFNLCIGVRVVTILGF